MSTIRHHAIVVTSYSIEDLRRARLAALRLYLPVSDIVTTQFEWASFLVAPEGWKDSDEGDARRDQFIAWLISQEFGDQSNRLTWVEIQYGGDQRNAKVIRGSDERARAYEHDT